MRPLLLVALSAAFLAGCSSGPCCGIARSFRGPCQRPCGPGGSKLGLKVDCGHIPIPIVKLHRKPLADDCQPPCCAPLPGGDSCGATLHPAHAKAAPPVRNQSGPQSVAQRPSAPTHPHVTTTTARQPQYAPVLQPHDIHHDDIERVVDQRLTAREITQLELREAELRRQTERLEVQVQELNRRLDQQHHTVPQYQPSARQQFEPLPPMYPSDGIPAFNPAPVEQTSASVPLHRTVREPEPWPYSPQTGRY